MPLIKIPLGPARRPSAARRRSARTATTSAPCCARSPTSTRTCSSQLFAADGSLNRYVNVYLNDEDVRVLDGLDTAVGECDVLIVLPAMAGGAVVRSSGRSDVSVLNAAFVRTLDKAARVRSGSQTG